MLELDKTPFEYLKYEQKCFYGKVFKIKKVWLLKVLQVRN